MPVCHAAAAALAVVQDGAMSLALDRLQRRRLLFALAASALPATAQPVPLHVAAASSLAGVMPKLAQGFQALQPGTQLQWHGDGSGLLLEALAQGRPFDLLLAADAETVASGVRRHLLRPDSVRVFAGNALVLLVPASSRLSVQRITDLARDEVQRIAMARPASAPVGRYARQAIDAARLWTSVQRKIVATDSAQAALALVLRNEVDAALVYRSDARLAGSAAREVALLSGHEPIRLTAAVTQASRQAEPATRFVQYLRSEPAQALLAAAGFSAP